MTTSRAAQEKPTSPRTDPQTMREVLVRLIDANAGLTLNGIEEAWDAMDAIEREAVVATPSLDAKRLRKAMQKHLADPWHGYLGDEEVIACTADEYSECPDEIAAEFARLDEGSATPDPER